MSTMYPEVVQRIHKEFDTASDRIIAEAKESQANVMKSKSAKKVMLEEIGFTASPEYQKFVKEQAKVALQDSTIAAIQALKVKFPFHKSITEEVAIKICKKYGLVFGEATLFKGFIPEKNLKEIANFKASYPTYYTKFFKSQLFAGSVTEITEAEYEENKNSPSWSYKYDKVTKPLMICAPETDMNMTGKMVRDFKVVDRPVEDPVVLFPIKQNDVQMYLILSKWGNEASDPELQDHSMN